MSYKSPIAKNLPPINVNFDRNPNHVPSPTAPLLSTKFSPARTQRNNYNYLIPEDNDLIPEDSQEELNNFSNYLGFDLKKHPTFLHIVLEALKAPLPSGWREIKDDTTDNIYFYNRQLNLSTWEHPLDFYYKEIIKREIKKSKNCVIQ